MNPPTKLAPAPVPSGAKPAISTPNRATARIWVLKGFAAIALASGCRLVRFGQQRVASVEWTSHSTFFISCKADRTEMEATKLRGSSYQRLGL